MLVIYLAITTVILSIVAAILWVNHDPGITWEELGNLWD